MNKTISSLLFTLLLGFAFTTVIPAMGEAEKNSPGGNGLPSQLPDLKPLRQPGGKPLQIAASTSIIGDVAEKVAGERAEVVTIIPRDQNPHSFELSPRDLVRLEEADVILINGLGLEAKLLSSLENLDGVPIIPVSVGIDIMGSHSGLDGHEHEQHEHEEHEHEEHEHEEHEHEEGGNPHFWFSPGNVMTWTENMVEIFCRVDPENCTEYRISGEAYGERLEELDRWIRAELDSLPSDKRKLVMDHDSFGYFARDYGFEILGSVIPAPNDQAEPSARSLAELAQLLRHEAAADIFVGRTAAPGLRRLTATLAAETGLDVEVHELLTGSLAAPGKPGDDYLGFMRFNAQVIIEALR